MQLPRHALLRTYVLPALLLLLVPAPMAAPLRSEALLILKSFQQLILKSAGRISLLLPNRLFQLQMRILSAPLP